jgi:uncharacterized protein (DUF2336 family)
MESQAAPSLQDLIELAGEKSPEKRRVLLEEISDLFLTSNGDANESEAELMGDIMHRLISDVEMSVRKNLSERLADIPDAPRDLITSLANDEIEVATPVLTRSGVLDDADLIEIVRHRSQEHMMAVARREAVSEAVSDALVDHGEEDVIETLLHNHNALISRRATSSLAAESKRVDKYQRPLLTRPDIPPTVAYDMFDWVSKALRQHILATYDLDESVIDEALADSKKAALGDEDEGEAVSEAEKLVQRLDSAGQLTENFLVQTMRDGRIDVFITALARKCNIKARTARRIFFDRGEEGLAIACRASGFDRSTYASILMLKHKADESTKVMAATAVEKMLSTYSSLTEQNAQRVLRFWNIREGETGASPAAGDGADTDGALASARV